MTTNTKRTLAIALCGALLLSYVGYQVLRLRSKTFETQTAEYDSVLETIRTEGFALRDELTIPLMSDGVLVYNYDDGDKVGITSVLAYEYDSEEAAQNKQRMDEMQIELENLLTIQDMQGSGNSNLELLSNQINEKANNLIDLSDTGITEGLSEVKEDLTFLFNKKQVALKEGESFEKRMIYLENQLAYLEESAGEPLRSIETPAEGYFSKLVDGYENLYTTEYLNDMNYSIRIHTLPWISALPMAKPWKRRFTKPSHLMKKIAVSLFSVAKKSMKIFLDCVDSLSILALKHIQA